MDPRVKPGGDRMSIFRFAPSPNGYLHLGHALSALLNADRAKAAGGRLLLRIEDIDAARCRPEYEAAIYEDLAWLGIAWEQPVRRQSEHYGDYRTALAKLDAMGLIYPSFESRAEIAALVAAREPWPRAVGLAECRHDARRRRTAAAAHRGHRRNALPAGIRDGDLRGPRLARPGMGAAGAAAIGAL